MKGTLDSPDTERWRTTIGFRVSAVVVCIGVFLLSIEVTSQSPYIWIFTSIVILFAWRCAFVPYLEATPTELVVRNPITVRHLSWSSIERIVPGSAGLIIVRRDRGWQPSAWAIQKGSLLQLTKTQTRADEVTEQLTMLVNDSVDQ